MRPPYNTHVRSLARYFQAPTEQYTVGWGIMDKYAGSCAKYCEGTPTPTPVPVPDPHPMPIPMPMPISMPMPTLCLTLTRRRVAREEGFAHHEVPGAPRPRRAPPLVGSHDQDRAALLGKVTTRPGWMEAARGRRPVGPESGLEGELTPRPVRLRALLLLLYLVTKTQGHSGTLP